MPATLISLEKIRRPSLQGPTIQMLDLCLQLRDEIDRLSLFLQQVKVQAERVHHVAEALGNELSLTTSTISSRSRMGNRNRRRLPR